MNPMTPMASRAGEPRVASRMRPMTPASDVEHGRESRHLAQADTRPYWMTREPPLNWVGVTLASSAPWTRVEDVVRDVQPELDERRADDRQERREPGRTSRGSRRSRCRGRPG